MFPPAAVAPFSSPATLADAYATALNVMGGTKAIEFANDNDIAVMLTLTNEEGTNLKFSNIRELVTYYNISQNLEQKSNKINFNVTSMKYVFVKCQTMHVKLLLIKCIYIPVNRHKKERINVHIIGHMQRQRRWQRRRSPWGVLHQYGRSSVGRPHHGGQPQARHRRQRHPQ